MGNNKKSIFLIDFDITISKKDSTDVLLETHQPEFKQELRKRYRAGEYSIREFIKYGLGSLNITKEQYIQTLQENVTIDETFIDFVKSGAEFKIVSAGARLNVQGTLSKYGINLPDSEVISNDLKFSGTDKNQITVENPFLDKEGYYGVDKKEAVENYKKKGDIPNAKLYLFETIKKTGNAALEVRCRNQLGLLFLEENKPEEALAQFKLVLEKDVNSADAHYGIGLIHEMQGDMIKARYEWRSAIRLNPIHAETRAKLNIK